MTAVVSGHGAAAVRIPAVGVPRTTLGRAAIVGGADPEEAVRVRLADAVAVTMGPKGRPDPRHSFKIYAGGHLCGGHPYIIIV